MTLAGLEQELGVPVVPSGENLSQLLDHLRASGNATTPRA